MLYKFIKIVEDILNISMPKDKLNIMEMGLLLSTVNVKKSLFSSRENLPI